MKKPIFISLLAILLVFGSCSDGLEESKEPYISQEYGITIPYKDVSSSKTYGLLKKLIDYLDDNSVYTIMFPSSNSNYPSFTKFNEYLENSKEAPAFFKNEDCSSVLILTYLDNLKTQRNDVPYHFKFSFLELVLSSNMSMSKMSINEKVQLMVLALERIKYEGNNPYTYNIMISIMMSSNYTPFLNNVTIGEAMMGATYYVKLNDNVHQEIEYTQQASDLVTGYAKQFINDNK